MKVIIISLERAQERRKRIIEQCDKLNLDCDIINAVDGVDFKGQINRRITLEGGYRQGELFKAGEVACTMSHILALRHAKINDYPYAIVLEDDVILAEDFEKRIKYLLKILPDNWEHVYLSGIPRLGFSYVPNLSIMNIAPTVFTECTHSMMINNTAYDKIIDYLSLFTTTTDDAYNYMIFYKSLKSETFYPFVTYVKDDYTYIWDHPIDRVHKSKQWFVNKMT